MGEPVEEPEKVPVGGDLEPHTRAEPWQPGVNVRPPRPRNAASWTFTFHTAVQQLGQIAGGSWSPSKARDPDRDYREMYERIYGRPPQSDVLFLGDPGSFPAARF